MVRLRCSQIVVIHVTESSYDESSLCPIRQILHQLRAVVPCGEWDEQNLPRDLLVVSRRTQIFLRVKMRRVRSLDTKDQIDKHSRTRLRRMISSGECTFCHEITLESYVLTQVQSVLAWISGKVLTVAHKVQPEDCDRWLDLAAKVKMLQWGLRSVGRKLPCECFDVAEAPSSVFSMPGASQYGPQLVAVRAPQAACYD